jgi:DNA-binding PadR family transcriptional regulator
MIPTVVAEHLSEKAQEEIANASRYEEDELLRALTDNPRASLAAMAATQGWKMRDGRPNKPKVQRILDRLRRDKLIKQERKGERYEITEKGKKALKQKDTDEFSNAA